MSTKIDKPLSQGDLGIRKPSLPSELKTFGESQLNQLGNTSKNIALFSGYLGQALSKSYANNPLAKNQQVYSNISQNAGQNQNSSDKTEVRPGDIQSSVKQEVNKSNNKTDNNPVTENKKNDPFPDKTQLNSKASHKNDAKGKKENPDETTLEDESFSAENSKNTLSSAEASTIPGVTQDATTILQTTQINATPLASELALQSANVKQTLQTNDTNSLNTPTKVVDATLSLNGNSLNSSIDSASLQKTDSALNVGNTPETLFNNPTLGGNNLKPEQGSLNISSETSNLIGKEAINNSIISTPDAQNQIASLNNTQNGASTFTLGDSSSFPDSTLLNANGQINEVGGEALKSGLIYHTQPIGSDKPGLLESQANQLDQIAIANNTPIAIQVTTGSSANGSGFNNSNPNQNPSESFEALENIGGVAGSKGGGTGVGAFSGISGENKVSFGAFTEKLPKAEGTNITQQTVSATLSAQQAGKKEVVIQLNPDNLGQVKINLTSQGLNQVSARFITNTTEAKQELQTHIDQLRNALEQQGVHLNQVTVVMAGEESQMKGSQQDSGQNQNPSHQQDPNKNDSSTQQNMSSSSQQFGREGQNNFAQSWAQGFSNFNSATSSSINPPVQQVQEVNNTQPNQSNSSQNSNGRVSLLI
ncbi:MAG: flagellar hook-length control protein FliK [Cyanobacteria bacterium]|nr:flagellar hook-length control protein FliK [Cyanobacteriota bacterium]